MKNNQKKNLTLIALGFIALVGTYNAIMINSGSVASNHSTFKRIDEVFGVVKQGRSIAVSTDWRKVTKAELAKPIIKTSAQTPSVENTESVATVAAVSSTLNLKLVEVINPKKWEQGVKSSDFSGAIATNNGIIESLNASLPEGQSIEIAFSEMTGNVFEYDLNGSVYSGMMYQVDQNSYMVTMTNGPLEGTRLRFAGETVDTSESQNYLAENHNVEVGTFGEEAEAQVIETETQETTQMAEASSFNFNQI